MKRSGLNKRTGFRTKNGLARKGGLPKVGIDRTKKQRNELKQSKRKKASKTDPRWAEIRRTDRAFSMYIRILYADKAGIVQCYTCSHRGAWKYGGIECGHFHSRSNIATRWYGDNARPQCSHCNQVLGGNMKVYRKRLRGDLGEVAFDNLGIRAKEVRSLTVTDVRRLRLRLESKLRKLRKDKQL